MQTNSQFINFFVELILRFFGKTPQFFRIVQVAMLVTALIGFIPEINAMLGIEIPIKFEKTFNLVLKVAGVLGVIFAQIVNQPQLIAKTQTDGTVLKVTNPEKLPFTAKSEGKVADKLHLPTVEVIPPVDTVPDVKPK